MGRLTLFRLCLAFAAWPIAALADEVKLGDDVTAGIQTSTEYDARPFGYRSLGSIGSPISETASCAWGIAFSA